MPDQQVGRTKLLILALAAFGLSTVVSRAPTVVLVLLGGLSLGLSIGWRPDSERDLGPWLFGVTGLFGMISIAGPVHDVIGSPPGWIFLATGLIWLGLGLAWLLFRSSTLSRRIIYVLCLGMTAAFGAVHVISAAGVGFDVLLLHEAAADAIASGLSPYSDAVTVPNGAPAGAPFIVGYPYPPFTALSYSVSSWLLGDPRWTTLIAWLIALAVLGARSWRDDGGDVPLGTMLATAAIPGWPLVLTTGWTESLSLALLALAVATWSRTRVSGVMSGLLLGSKQYLLAAAPLLVTNRTATRWIRAWWAGVGLLVAFAPVFIWGVSDFVGAAIRFHLEAPARPDGTSIVGLLDILGVEWAPPVWIMILVVVVLAVFLGRLVTNRRGWLAAFGVMLSAALFLSSQAFTNYWFLIAGIAALAIASGQHDPPAETIHSQDAATVT